MTRGIHFWFSLSPFQLLNTYNYKSYHEEQDYSTAYEPGLNRTQQLGLGPTSDLVINNFWLIIKFQLLLGIYFFRRQSKNAVDQIYVFQKFQLHILLGLCSLYFPQNFRPFTIVAYKPNVSIIFQ